MAGARTGTVVGALACLAAAQCGGAGAAVPAGATPTGAPSLGRTDPKAARETASGLATTTASAPPPASRALTPEQAVRLRRISDLRLSPDGARVAFVVSDTTDAGASSHVWLGDLRRQEIRPFTMSAKSETHPRWSPDGRSLAFLSARTGETQVHVIALDGGEASELTHVDDGVDDFAWAPDGKRIAFLAKADRPADPKDAPQVKDREDDLARVWIVDVASKKARTVTAGPYRIDELAWPTNDRVAILATDRPRREGLEVALYDVDPATGLVRAGRPGAGVFGSLTFSPSGARLAFRASATGGVVEHDLFVQESRAADPVDRTRALDRAVLDARWQDDRALVLRAIDGFRYSMYRLAPGSSAPAKIDVGPLTVRAFDVARDGTIVFVGTAFDHLPELYVKPPVGPARRLGRVQEPAWDAVTLADAEMLRVKSFDGAEIESALFRPKGAATGGKRPLVLLVHGGPNSAFTSDYFWFNSWPQLLVARGFEVLLPNPRGSLGYGEPFAKANRGDWGGGDYEDLLAVVDHVIADGEVDPARLGIGGWSYGGEMTAWAIGHTTRFRAAVVGAGVYDQTMEFETEDDPAGDEWHFGTPWEHPDVFARNSPSTFIAHATTPTLIVHGEADHNNPVGQGKALYRALQHLGVESELVTYPGEPHGPRKAGHQIDILKRMVAWFEGHLAPR